MNCPDATRNGDAKNSTEEFQWLRSDEFQSLHRTVVLGFIVLVVATLAVVVPLKIFNLLPSHYTWLRMLVVPLVLSWEIISLTTVPLLRARFGISGRSCRGMLLLLLFHLPLLVICVVVFISL